MLRQKTDNHKRMLDDKLAQPFQGELEKYGASPRTQLAEAR